MNVKNIKYFIILITGFILSIGISYAYDLKASLVTYDNRQTTLESLDVNGALNELGVLTTTRITILENEISDGKTLIANAITESGVETNNSQSFEMMSENIKLLSTLNSSDGYEQGYIDGYNQRVKENQIAALSFSDSRKSVKDDGSDSGYYSSQSKTRTVTNTPGATSMRISAWKSNSETKDNLNAYVRVTIDGVVMDQFSNGTKTYDITGKTNIQFYMYAQGGDGYWSQINISVVFS